MAGCGFSMAGKVHSKNKRLSAITKDLSDKKM
jgi:hypothetical protein